MKLAILASALVGSVLCLTGVLPFSPFASGSSKGSDQVQTSWYPSGQAQSRAQLEDGVRDGPACEWYANGQERCSGEYKKGLREGAWVFYTPEGMIDPNRSGNYSGGERTGS